MSRFAIIRIDNCIKKCKILKIKGFRLKKANFGGFNLILAILCLKTGQKTGKNKNKHPAPEHPKAQQVGYGARVRYGIGKNKNGFFQI